MSEKQNISEDEVQNVAHLSRISLQEGEVQSLAKDLAKILQYITNLEKLDISNTEPTSHVMPLKNVVREDKPVPSLKQEEAVKFAVEEKNGFFKVPKVIE